MCAAKKQRSDCRKLKGSLSVAGKFITDKQAQLQLGKCTHTHITTAIKSVQRTRLCTHVQIWRKLHLGSFVLYKLVFTQMK